MTQTDLPGTRLTRRYLIGSLHQRNHSPLRPHDTREHHRNYPKDEGEPKDGSSMVIDEASELSGQTTEASGQNTKASAQTTVRTSTVDY